MQVQSWVIEQGKKMDQFDESHFLLHHVHSQEDVCACP